MLTTTMTNMSSIVNDWVLRNKDVNWNNLLGLDMTWIESNKDCPALIQVCIGTKCLLFELKTADKVPIFLENLLGNGEKKVASFDILKLQRIVRDDVRNKSPFCSLFNIENGVDLLLLANEKLSKKTTKKTAKKGRKAVVQELLGESLPRPLAVLDRHQVYIAAAEVYSTYRCAKRLLLMKPP